MAQVIGYYAATVGGASAMYYWPRADSTSGGTRIYAGTTIHLPSNYSSSIVNGRAPMLVPSGWINWAYIMDPSPVYETITDPCSPPENLAINGSVMTITGGGGGDLNEFTAFGVSWRERAIDSATWSGWSDDEDVTSRSVDVDAASGMVRQYRVRTKGSAGADYYSVYVECSTLVNGNTAAGTPVVFLPIAGAVTYSGTPTIQVECPEEPDGDTMTMQRSIDGGEWVSAAELGGNGGMVFDTISVGEGAHTIRYRLIDSNGEYGGEDSVTFTRAALRWRRAIAAGDTIANREISFVADIQEMLDKVNAQRGFYGLPPVVLPGTVGRVGDWGGQLTSMQNGLDECCEKLGKASCGFDAAIGWPTARQINALREAIANI